MDSSRAVEIDTEEHIYAHPEYTKNLFDHQSLGAQTLYEVILHGMESYGDRPLFSYRNSSDQVFQSYTYTQVRNIIHDIGSAIVHMLPKKASDTFIGIYGSVTVHYALVLYSSWAFSYVPVGIYDTLGKDGVRFIIKHAELELIFADSLQRVNNLIQWQDEKARLKTIVSLVQPLPELIEEAKAKDIQIITLDDIIKIGAAHRSEPLPPKSTDTAVVMYTSGSTGEPKGCVITHENFACAIAGTLLGMDLVPGEILRVLNFMPLAHMFGCTAIVVTTYLGGEIGFWQGKVEKLMDDYRDFKPSLLVIVPRLLNKLYDRVMGEAHRRNPSGGDFIKSAVHSKLAEIQKGNFSKDTVWDNQIFNRIRATFGDSIKHVVVSSAPLSVEVADFCRAAFSCPFFEIYGQTECVMGCWQTKNDNRSGETGVPTAVNHIKLIDVPEKGYYAKDRVGEICIRSKAVFKGYLKDETKTRDTIDDNGWLFTGDIGRWTEHNTMQIIDRKKNIYKLSQGEFIAPEKIERAYERSEFVSQVFVYGDSLQHYLVAIVVLDNEFVKKWAIENSYDATFYETPETNEKLRQIVLIDMIDHGKQQDLMSFEQIKVVALIKEPFTVENGLMTPTFKARRYAVEKKYKKLFDELYKSQKF